MLAAMMRHCHCDMRMACLTRERMQYAGAQMQESYYEFNEHAAAAGNSRGHFMVDLCRPGHMTACLRTFQVRSVHGCVDKASVRLPKVPDDAMFCTYKRPMTSSRR